MSEMVEWVARALCVNAGHDPDKADLYSPGTPGLTTETRNWHAYEDSARDAIGAMREPTEAMVEAGREAMPFGGPMAQGWTAMIDAALKE